MINNPADKLLAQNWEILNFKIDFTLKGNVNCPLKTIATLTKVFDTFGSNLLILPWTGHDISRGQAYYWHMDGRTHTHNNNTKTGLGKNAQ